MPGGFVCSASMKGEGADEDVRDVVAWRSAAPQAASRRSSGSSTRRTRRRVSGSTTSSLLGPVFVLKLVLVPKELGRRLVGELWLLPGRHADPRALDEVRAVAGIPGRGRDPRLPRRARARARRRDPQTKTKSALEFFAAELAAAAARSVRRGRAGRARSWSRATNRSKRWWSRAEAAVVSSASSSVSVSPPRSGGRLVERPSCARVDVPYCFHLASLISIGRAETNTRSVPSHASTCKCHRIVTGPASVKTRTRCGRSQTRSWRSSACREPGSAAGARRTAASDRTAGRGRSRRSGTPSASSPSASSGARSRTCRSRSGAVKR